jgi:hypothetical protein
MSLSARFGLGLRQPANRNQNWKPQRENDVFPDCFPEIAFVPGFPSQAVEKIGGHSRIRTYDFHRVKVC